MSSIVNLGITGSREGFTNEQWKAFTEFVDGLLSRNPIHYFHQGQCVGVDVEAAKYLAEKQVLIVSHPPINKASVDESPIHFTREDKTYFERNRDIVDESDFMLVVPNTMQHRSYGGTWYTHDYAVKQNKPLCIIYPNGTIEYKGVFDAKTD